MTYTNTESVPILDRAKAALDAKSEYDLAKKLGIATATISGYKKRRSLPMEQCIKIAEKTGVSLDWLILGKGAMRLDQTNNNPQYDDGDAAWIPLYDVHLSAGNGLEVWDEQIIQHIPLSRRWLNEEGLHAKDLAGLFVDGDSMYPTLLSTDIAIINRARLHGDGVFAVRIGNVLRVKRLQWLTDGRLIISSDNKAYRSEEINPVEMAEQFNIIGHCHTRIGRIL